MQAIIFTGIPGAGKTSFYRQEFFATHVRISLDLLKTRARETRFLETCLQTGQQFVVDNTSPSREERAKYIQLARQAGFSITGYYFASRVDPCLQRNAERKPPRAGSRHRDSVCSPTLAASGAAGRLRSTVLCQSETGRIPG